IKDQGTSGNILEDNLIGTDASGTRPLGNFFAGVLINNGASGNQIRRAQTGNVISANVPIPATQSSPAQGGFGVFISDSTTQTNLVTGNLIGTDRTGTQALGNQLDGVEIANGADFNQIGAAGKPNVISGNTHAGVEVNGQSTSDDTVLGNLIGTDVTGTLPLGNGGRFVSDLSDGFGVLIDAGAESIDVKSGNVISGNQTGVAIKNDDGFVNVIGNYIGTDVTGTKRLFNFDGVHIEQGGLQTLVETNVISGNDTGVRILQGGGTVLSNLIGTDATGEHPLGNSFGIDVR